MIIIIILPCIIANDIAVPFRVNVHLTSATIKRYSDVTVNRGNAHIITEVMEIFPSVVEIFPAVTEIFPSLCEPTDGNISVSDGSISSSDGNISMI